VKKIIVILFLLSVFFISFLPVKDTDFGWHYRCGQQFLTTGKFCLKNEFSYFLPNYQAYNPSFLYDITLAAIYNHFGFVGIGLLGAVILTLCAFFIFQLFSGPTWLRIIAFYLIFWLSYSTFGLGIRSQTVSFLFFVITLFALTKKVENYFPVSNNKLQFSIFLPFLFLIWVNTHIGFFLGPVLLLFFFIEQIILTAFRRPHKSGKLIFFLIILGLSLIVTFINPFGLNVYLEIFRHLQAPLNTMIAEWVAPPLWQKLLIITLSMITFIINVGVRLSDQNVVTEYYPVTTKKNNIFSIFLLLFFALITLQAQRNLPFFYTIFFYIILNLNFINKVIENTLKEPPKKQMARAEGLLTARNEMSTGGREARDRIWENDHINRSTINQLALSLLASLAFVFAVINLPQTISFHQSWENYCNKGLIAYPCQALKKTNLKQLSGNLFTAYEWGGFLIWQTPKLKVFSDGRMSAWKDEKGQYPYQVYLYIIQARSGWNEILKKHKTDYLLIGNNTFLDLELQKKAAKYDWKETYRDDIAVFYRQ
jgi:hypothetical protein